MALIHLDAVHQGGPSLNGRGHVHGLRHFLQVGASLQGRTSVGVNAVRALHRMGHGQGDEGLFPICQGPLGHDPLVIVHEAVIEIGPMLAHLRESFQVAIFFALVCHGSPFLGFMVPERDSFPGGNNPD